MKIRELAALSISTILGKSGGNFNLEKFVVESLLEDRELSHNLCHGKILQVRKLWCVVVVDYWRHYYTSKHSDAKSHFLIKNSDLKKVQFQTLKKFNFDIKIA